MAYTDIDNSEEHFQILHYTGDGSTTVFSWTEDDISYKDTDQIKVRVNNAEVTAFTVSGDTQITFTNAPANGASILIYLDEWYNINPTIIADDYLANDVALSSLSVFSIPIHQRTENFQLRVFNDSFCSNIIWMLSAILID